MNIILDKTENNRGSNSVQKTFTQVPLASTVTPSIVHPQQILKEDDTGQEVDVILDYNKSKLAGLKNDMKNGSWAKKNIIKAWFALLGIPEQSIEEADKLCADKNFNKSVKDFVQSKQVSGMKEFLSNERNQEEIIQLLKNYTKDNNYPNLNVLLDRKIVQKEIKSYLKEASASYGKK